MATYYLSKISKGFKISVVLALALFASSPLGAEEVEASPPVASTEQPTQTGDSQPSTPAGQATSQPETPQPSPEVKSKISGVTFTKGASDKEYEISINYILQKATDGSPAPAQPETAPTNPTAENNTITIPEGFALTAKNPLTISIPESATATEKLTPLIYKQTKSSLEANITLKGTKFTELADGESATDFIFAGNNEAKNALTGNITLENFIGKFDFSDEAKMIGSISVNNTTTTKTYGANDKNIFNFTNAHLQGENPSTQMIFITNGFNDFNLKDKASFDGSITIKGGENHFSLEKGSKLTGKAIAIEGGKLILNATSGTEKNSESIIGDGIGTEKKDRTIFNITGGEMTLNTTRVNGDTYALRIENTDFNITGGKATFDFKNALVGLNGEAQASNYISGQEGVAFNITGGEANINIVSGSVFNGDITLGKDANDTTTKLTLQAYTPKYSSAGQFEYGNITLKGGVGTFDFKNTSKFSGKDNLLAVSGGKHTISLTGDSTNATLANVRMDRKVEVSGGELTINVKQYASINEIRGDNSKYNLAGAMFGGSNSMKVTGGKLTLNLSDEALKNGNKPEVQLPTIHEGLINVTGGEFALNLNHGGTFNKGVITIGKESEKETSEAKATINIKNVKDETTGTNGKFTGAIVVKEKGDLGITLEYATMEISNKNSGSGKYAGTYDEIENAFVITGGKTHADFENSALQGHLHIRGGEDNKFHFDETSKFEKGNMNIAGGKNEFEFLNGSSLGLAFGEYGAGKNLIITGGDNVFTFNGSKTLEVDDKTSCKSKFLSSCLEYNKKTITTPSALASTRTDGTSAQKDGAIYIGGGKNVFEFESGANLEAPIIYNGGDLELHFSDASFAKGDLLKYDPNNSFFTNKPSETTGTPGKVEVSIITNKWARTTELKLEAATDFKANFDDNVALSSDITLGEKTRISTLAMNKETYSHIKGGVSDVASTLYLSSTQDIAPSDYKDFKGDIFIVNTNFTNKFDNTAETQKKYHSLNFVFNATQITSSNATSEAADIDKLSEDAKNLLESKGLDKNKNTFFYGLKLSEEHKFAQGYSSNANNGGVNFYLIGNVSITDIKGSSDDKYIFLDAGDITNTLKSATAGQHLVMAGNTWVTSTPEKPADIGIGEEEGKEEVASSESAVGKKRLAASYELNENAIHLVGDLSKANDKDKKATLGVIKDGEKSKDSSVGVQLPGDITLNVGEEKTLLEAINEEVKKIADVGTSKTDDYLQVKSGTIILKDTNITGELKKGALDYILRLSDGKKFAGTAMDVKEIKFSHPVSQAPKQPKTEEEKKQEVDDLFASIDNQTNSAKKMAGVWEVGGNSRVGKLGGIGGIIDLRGMGTPTPATTSPVASSAVLAGASGGNSHRYVDIGTLEGQNLIFLMGVDTAKPDESAVVRIGTAEKGTAGTNHLYVEITGSELKEKILLASIAQGGSADYFDTGHYNDGVVNFTPKFESVAGNDGSYEYYLSKILASINEEKANVFKSALGVFYRGWRVETNNLNLRMGDLHNLKATSGAWVRVSNGMGSDNDKNSDFYTTLQGGYDYGFSFDSARDFLGVVIGGSIISSKGSGYTSSGKNLSVGLYNTYVADNGLYVDTIAKYLRIGQDYSFKDETMDFDDKSKNVGVNAFLIGAEAGWRYFFGGGDDTETKGSYFVEPQVEFIYGYIGGAELNAQTKSDKFVGKLSSDNALISRLGAAVGKEFGFDSGAKLQLRLGLFYVNELNTGAGVKVSQFDLSETLEAKMNHKVLLSLGANTALNDDWRIYADVNRSFLGNYNTDYNINVGARWSFGAKPQKVEKVQELQKSIRMRQKEMEEESLEF
ncbi:autotransporter outer membrane beta-barrel domain-containing protein [Helicobacter sp. 11S02596-1]|uniref:autotransporter outer membrane beta-barrel domain-containing protein n=1 Tax=Helicobacter sp. 11S02596-1 TaxID=1476194 RepID=UPI000BA58FBD|nr:autotransporter outer membrane beta-barrel domain-containing protein [Helicobacter sp. 11S02596-1]PAF43620.1 hypothetical protein BJI48_05030 [Helicobacter sp. 11S02596-1]